MDILTKPLPWFMLKVFVEPLLLWKGDTQEVPSGSQNLEGSDAGPCSAVPDEHVNHERERNVDAGFTSRQIPTELYGNQYAVLFDTRATGDKV